MDQLDEAYSEEVAVILRAMYAAKRAKENDVPDQIEEVKRISTEYCIINMVLKEFAISIYFLENQGLYLGSIGAANNRSFLKSLNVTHILTVASSLPPSYPNEFKYKIVDVQDRESINIAQYFDECFSFIEEAKEMGGNVLVHCFVGRSRSVTIVVAYLMKKRGMSCSEALQHVKSKRAVAFPNSGFLLQLQSFEESLRGQKRENSSTAVLLKQ